MQRPVLAIGPSNYAGQATAWARAVRAVLTVEAWSFAGVPLRGGGFGFDVDRRFNRVAFRAGTLWGARAQVMFRDTTHIALDGFKSFARWDRHGHFPADARRLEALGHSMALIAHGSDVREPAAHLARDKWSYFSVGSEEWRARLTAQTARNRAFAEESGWPVFYSTPDLGFDLPGGTWLPVVVDVDAWASDAPLLERERPRVVHVPSRRSPPIKGTQYISPVLQQLHDEGVIEYVEPSGMQHREVCELVRTCDVVVDQLLFGSYGVAAVEAMAAGRVTIGRMVQPVRDRMEEAPSILEATPNSLREVIGSIRERRGELRLQAESNLKFVRRWHDGVVSAALLRDFLGLGDGL
ncbi:glycosyltransferase [Tessaracoccus sp. Z1128]